MAAEEQPQQVIRLFPSANPTPSNASDFANCSQISGENPKQSGRTIFHDHSTPFSLWAVHPKRCIEPPPFADGCRAGSCRLAWSAARVAEENPTRLHPVGGQGGSPARPLNGTSMKRVPVPLTVSTRWQPRTTDCTHQPSDPPPPPSQKKTPRQRQPCLAPAPKHCGRHATGLECQKTILKVSGRITSSENQGLHVALTNFF